MRKTKTSRALCPFLDRECEGEECALFNQRFERCEWGLLTYNLYLVASELRQRPDIPGK